MAVVMTAGGWYGTRDEYLAESKRIHAAMKELEAAYPNMRDFIGRNDVWREMNAAARARGEELREREAALIADFKRHAQYS